VVGGSGGTGPSHVGGGGWKSCSLTWYDPGLGGINSSHGQKDPHARTASGEPYDRNKFTCAADASFSFGTLIAIRAHGREVTVKVNDRGGAVHGTHFDLSVAARNALGGATSGTYKVVGRAGHPPPRAGHAHREGWRGVGGPLREGRRTRRGSARRRP
jgi:3D (Asp-Asp-Asp) domain-containing protein